MDMDVDMDVPYSVSVFLIRPAHPLALLHPILGRETSTYASSLPIFIPNPDNYATSTSGLSVDIILNSIMTFRDTTDTT
jgi:hypothetical protein